MSDHAAASRRRLPRARLAPVGGRGLAGVVAWGAGCALVAGAGWLAWTALRPLDLDAPAGADISAPAVPPPLPARTLEARQRELDALAAAANLFAPNRAVWPAFANETEDDPDDAEMQIASADVAGEPDAGAASPGDPVASIPVEPEPPPAVAQRLKALTLMGIYGADDRLTAVIRDSTFSKVEGQTRHHRAGDIVGKEQWELLGVDADRDRVILRRAGVNVELRMYPETLATAAAADDAPPVSAAPTPEDVRRDLEAAGVPADDIEELLRLAQSDDPLEGDPPVQADASDGANADRSSSPGSPAMPAELSALLRSMARPTTPEGERGIDRINRQREKQDEGEEEGGG